MDYMTLLTDTAGVAAGRFSFLTYRRRGQDVCSVDESDLTMVFCLQGKVEYQSRTREYSLGTGYFTVVDKRAIVTSACPTGTVLLKYSLPPFLSAYVIEWMCVFETPIFPVLTISERLAIWIDYLVRGMVRGESGNFYAVQRRELALRLLEYPSRQLGGIYDPLSTCIRHCVKLGKCPFTGTADCNPSCEESQSCR